MANARAQARAVGGAAAQPGAAAEHHFPWGWTIAIGGLALAAAGIGVAATRGGDGNVISPPRYEQQGGLAEPTVTATPSIEDVVAGRVKAAESRGNKIVYSGTGTTPQDGILFLIYNPKRADERTVLNLLAMRRDLIRIQDEYVGKPYFSSTIDGMYAMRIEVTADTDYNSPSVMDAGSSLNLTAHAHENAHDYGTFGVSILNEGTVEFIAAKAGEELAKKNPSYLEELSKSKVLFNYEGRTLEAGYLGFSADEVEKEYEFKKSIESVYKAVKGGESFIRSSVLPITWKGMKVNPQDIPEEEKVNLLDIPIAQLSDYGLRTGDTTSNLVYIFLYDLERIVGEESVRLGIHEIAQRTLQTEFDYVQYYKYMRSAALKAAPDKIAALDRHFEARFFGPELFQNAKAQLPASQQVSSTHARATATVTALPNQYSRLLLPSEQRALEAKLGR